MGQKIDKELKQILRKELKEYEKATPMTAEELKAVREWVRAGNSVHANSCNAVYEGGRPVDFLDVYREEEEIRRILEPMTEEEQDKYILGNFGIDRNEGPDPAPTYEELKGKAIRLYRMCMLYRKVLSRNGLLAETDGYLLEHINEEYPFEEELTIELTTERMAAEWAKYL